MTKDRRRLRRGIGISLQEERATFLDETVPAMSSCGRKWNRFWLVIEEESLREMCS